MRGLVIFSVLLLITNLRLYSQEKSAYLLRYNEINAKGEERIISTIAWQEEMAPIPDYVYYDKDLQKKVVVKTRMMMYNNEPLAEIDSLKVLGGNYASVKIECKNGKTAEILDLQKVLPEYAGDPLAFEVRAERDKISVLCFPFDSDFPFKFEEDIVTRVFTTEKLHQLCSGK